MANDSLTRAHIVGDVLDPFASSVPLTVMYDGRPVFNGMELRSPSVSLKPRVDIGGDDFRVAYTLVMVDLDAPNPSNPTLREYLHWMVTDVPSSTNNSFG
uniref:Protein HEADING DATE 3A n=1 Tax=Triticum urartu TaxID=4572 RepID=A0A8R7REQ9_TRIUA